MCYKVEDVLQLDDWSGFGLFDEFTSNREATSRRISEIYLENRFMFLNWEEKIKRCDGETIKMIKDGIELGLLTFSERLKTDKSYSFPVGEDFICRVCDHNESRIIADILISQTDWHKYFSYSPRIERINRNMPIAFASSPRYWHCFYGIFTNSQTESEFVGYFAFRKENNHPQLANIEYYVLPNYRGRNVVYRVLLEFLKNGEMPLTDLKGIKGTARISNLPSNKILNKLGFEYLGIQKYTARTESGQPDDDNLYFYELKETK